MSTTDCKKCLWNFEQLNENDERLSGCLNPYKGDEQIKDCPYYDEGKD